MNSGCKNAEARGIISKEICLLNQTLDYD